ncbi:hypothetical protein BCR34DRAFT_130335 [Clohesyomyces aquaticus]|uniref:Secreted protein n=1 Tax=Clohesyomyces aquaticus TaxID=1231657 RepID=A0A1Y2AAC7_9PLEO|nr:hypothetical protein BCR34DRAFT_130335 [Clohesyomyces aquaticus]
MKLRCALCSHFLCIVIWPFKTLASQPRRFSSARSTTKARHGATGGWKIERGFVGIRNNDVGELLLTPSCPGSGSISEAFLPCCGACQIFGDSSASSFDIFCSLLLSRRYSPSPETSKAPKPTGSRRVVQKTMGNLLRGSIANNTVKNRARERVKSCSTR